jgi:hypothetical protein
MNQRAIKPPHNNPVFAGGETGVRVLVDEKYPAIVRMTFPQGSSSYLFPHAKVDFEKGDRNVAVALSRLSKA